MRINGQQGYLDATQEILKTAATFKAALKSIPELKIIGQPTGTVVAFTLSNDKVYNIYNV
jgi:glutamate/tyrosine decarboxylase-like PLP-dependent enzyme